jgi:hypothetical protein
MTITGLRKFIPKLTTEQHAAARWAIKGLSQVLIADRMGVTASMVAKLVHEAEDVIGEPLPRALGNTKLSTNPELAERYKRRAAHKAEMPDIEVAPGVIETCGFCGLRWHTEDWPNVPPWNGAPRCDLKIRRLQSAYIGSALGAET